MGSIVQAKAFGSIMSIAKDSGNILLHCHLMAILSIVYTPQILLLQLTTLRIIKIYFSFVTAAIHIHLHPRFMIYHSIVHWQSALNFPQISDCTINKTPV